MESLTQEAINVISKMPDTAEIVDIMYRLYVIDKVRKGREAVQRGEVVLKAAGCEIIEGSGSRIAVSHEGRKATFHRPHPGKDALRYQIRAAREFLESIGVTP